MSWIDQTLQDYGRALGLENLRFNDQNVASLHFEEMGSLFIERLDEIDQQGAVLVYLVRELQRPTADVYARALEVCHWEHHRPLPVNAALRQDEFLVFSVRTEAEDFSLPALERVVAQLDQCHKEVLEGVAA